MSQVVEGLLEAMSSIKERREKDFFKVTKLYSSKLELELKLVQCHFQSAF
jgi:hypothetical protein